MRTTVLRWILICSLATGATWWAARPPTWEADAWSSETYADGALDMVPPLILVLR